MDRTPRQGIDAVQPACGAIDDNGVRGYDEPERRRP